jgi:predicted Zn-dependent peptidase
LRRGTQQRNAQEVDDLIESMGAQLSADVSAEEAALALTVPAELAERAVDVLLEVALEPAFTEEEVASARRRLIAGLQNDLDEPSSVAGRALITLGYGPMHPYGHPAHGFKREVETFTRDDVLAFHATRYRQPGSVLVVVGHQPVTELSAFAKARLEGRKWPEGGVVPALDFRQMPPPPGLRAVAVHKPDSTQAQVRIVAPGLPRNSPRYPEAIVANHMGIEILGVSCISNMAAGILPQPLTEEEVIETTHKVRGDFIALLEGVIDRL